MASKRGTGVRRTVVVVTALRVEFEAVRAGLTSVAPVRHPKGTIYEKGLYSADSVAWEVVLVEVGAGNNVTALETERALSYFSPHAVFFVGVAGGVKDVELGDVVVATKVVRYESGADAGTFHPRPDTVEPPYAMVQSAKYLARNATWLQRLKGRARVPAPTVHIGAVAAGEKVIKSHRSATARFLRATYGDVVAVEMEGAGFLEAVHSNDDVEALLIRGISDLLDKKDTSDRAGWQKTAAAHASAFLFSMLDLISGTSKAAPPEFVRFGHPSESMRCELVTQATTIRLLDQQGGRASFEKCAVIRATSSSVQTYVDDMQADGDIEGFEAAPGTIEYVVVDGFRYVVLSRFDRPLQAGSELERTFSCELLASFTAGEEFWVMRRPHPSKWMELTIEFPSTRPWKSHVCYAIEGDDATLAPVQAAEVKTRDGLRAIRWRVTAPDPRASYKLVWTW